MILCVGAASRRVVQEAASMRVHQIVASRRQVGEFEAGYTGYTSDQFAQVVKILSDGQTNVVRDHGGPHQNGNEKDDWTAAFDADIEAGFDGLHLDVCKLPKGDQPDELIRLCKRYRDKAFLEIGGEREAQVWNDLLLETALEFCKPSVVVADFGGHVWADRQCGHIKRPKEGLDLVRGLARHGVVPKAHNFDWFGGRKKYGHFLYNIAPELGNTEVDAWLRVLSYEDGLRLLGFGYGSGDWKRWFKDDEGTWFERGRCGLRYHLENPMVSGILDMYDDTHVREAIRDAILAG